MIAHLYLCPEMRTRDLNKEQLVRDEAIRMLVEQGFDGFSMNKLAKKCGISVATLYIYYRDKDDMVKKIGVEVGSRFFEAMLKDFDPAMPFVEGLHQQWKNRVQHALKYPLHSACFEIIRHSGHGEYVLQESLKAFKNAMKTFFNNCVQRKEIEPLPLEVFWSVAYGPLYALLRFHSEGKSFGEYPFTFNKKMMEQAFKLVVRALT
jgi:TetR/AcrR family transcriptional repressor of multidrug resistance operon